MRIVLFVLTSVFSALAFPAQPISGLVDRSGTDIFVQATTTDSSNTTSCIHYKLATTDADSLAALLRLSPGDYLTATGTMDVPTCTATIDSIDYVGLKRMLGSWYSKEGMITVRSFNHLVFYPHSDQNIGDTSSNCTTPYMISYKYSLTPSDGKEWVLFLSDTNSTIFATLEFKKETAVMNVHDSESGQVVKTILLFRKEAQ